MKKLIITLSLAAAVLTSGCVQQKKEWALAPTDTLETIRAEARRDEAAVKAEFARKKSLIQAAWKEEITAAKQDARAGLISWDAYLDRKYRIEGKYTRQLHQLADRAERRLYVIGERLESQYFAWNARK